MGLKIERAELKGKVTMNGWVVHDVGQGYKWLYVNRTRNKYDKLFSTSFRKFCKDVFLPQGFPESVHSDYVPYQIWDTVQAFASTILGTLTTHSIMRGVGVGDSTATPLAAAITWILKDGTGMVGRILFAWWNGPELDAQCKKWRLFADVLNDLAMGIELALPYFPSHATAVLSISSGMKSLVGVAGGATRAAITQHQALSNNLADVSAKDGSQETCVNLIASLVGILVLSYLNVSSFVEIYYVILVAVHIYANYSAVRSLRFETLNENRLALVVKNYLTKSSILGPEEINKRESLMFFRRPSKELCGFDIVIGDSLDKIIGSLKTDESNTEIVSKAPWASKAIKQTKEFGDPFDFFHRVRKIGSFVIPDIETRTIYVALQECATPSGIIDAYVEAFMHGIYLSMDMNLRPDIIHEAKTTAGPLTSLYEKSRQLRNDIDSVDNLIKAESTKFSKLLDVSEWKKEVNLLSVGPYRSSWDVRTF